MEVGRHMEEKEQNPFAKSPPLMRQHCRDIKRDFTHIVLNSWAGLLDLDLYNSCIRHSISTFFYFDEIILRNYFVINGTQYIGIDWGWIKAFSFLTISVCWYIFTRSILSSCV